MGIKELVRDHMERADALKREEKTVSSEKKIAAEMLPCGGFVGRSVKH